jgi:hypothetical protein
MTTGMVASVRSPYLTENKMREIILFQKANWSG